MLLRVVLLKSVLSSVPSDLESQRLFCGVVIGALNDLADNCVVFVDEAGATPAELFEVAHQWPIKYRTAVLKLLTVLRTRHRFVKVPNGYALSEKCPEPTCRYCIGIANVMTPDALLAAGACICPLADLKAGSVVDIREYSTSAFHAARRRAFVYQLNRGEWDQPTFEANVLVPLFSYSKVVKIFDRWVGNSIVTRSFDGKVLNQAQVTERFRAALDWIVGVFIRTSRQSPRLLEVYSGVDTRSMDKKEIAIVASALKGFENEIRTKYSFPEFRLIMKEETQRGRMLHSRYLITDQLGVVMERGFDLLMDDGRIQDCVVAHCPDAGKVENVIRTLPDLP